VQQENDRLRARRFQLELERGDRLQRIVDLEAENHALEENADVHEIERQTLLRTLLICSSRWRTPRYRCEPYKL
jgi:hypothetical protein